MATKASRSSIMPYYGLFCPELAFSRRSAHKGKRMELRNHLRREFVPRSGQDYGDKSMVSPASPAGLVLRSGISSGNQTLTRCAFLGINPTDEVITSTLPIIRR